MRASPLQLRHYFFTKLEIAEREGGTLNPRPASEPFDFDGVAINTLIDFGTGEGQKGNPTDFALRIGVKIENKEGKPAPYNLAVEMIGYFSVDPAIPVAERKSIVIINGASLLFGAIREMVTTLSSRSARGVIVLPTVNFLNLKEQLAEVSPEQAQSKQSKKMSRGASGKKRIAGVQKKRRAPA
jgi:preprotein translocase subunit SecB